MSSGRVVLVTGGAGFMGSRFVTHHMSEFPEDRVIVLDALTYAGKLENLAPELRASPRFEFVHGNVRSPLLMESLLARSDVVLHFAAETHVPRSISDSLIFMETDVLGTQSLLNALVRHRERVALFVHVSSSEVYGSAQREVMDESHPLEPCTPYAAAKCAADRLVHASTRTYDLPSVIVRPFNNYGPAQHLEKLVPRMITSALLDEPMTLHGDGRASRDWLHVDDTCRALEAVLAAAPELERGEVLNVGTGVATEVGSIARAVLGLLGRSEDLIVHLPERPGQVARQCAGVERAAKRLGFTARVRFEDGLESTVEWYRAHRSWWENLRWMRSVPVTGVDGQTTEW